MRMGPIPPMIPLSVEWFKKDGTPKDKPVKPFDSARKLWKKMGRGDSSQMAYLAEKVAKLKKKLNSLTPKSVPAGTKLVLFGRYVLNVYVGIVRYFLRTTKLSAPKSTYRHNAQIGEYRTILTSAKKIRF